MHPFSSCGLGKLRGGNLDRGTGAAYGGQSLGNEKEQEHR